MEGCDMTEARALMYVHMDPPLGAEDEFHAWYDDHAAKRFALPGFLSARRFWNVNPYGPRHLAWYDLEDASVLQSEAYLSLREKEKVYDQAFMGRLTMNDRRVYEALDIGQPWTKPWTDHPPYMITMTMDPRPEMVDDYHQWYLQEHCPMLMETVPGWRRILRYRQLDGNGSSYLAIHEIESPEVFQTPEFKAATSTPWRDKVFGYVTRRERLTFKLIKGF
jgi:hypothetical protein